MVSDTLLLGIHILGKSAVEDVRTVISAVGPTYLVGLDAFALLACILTLRATVIYLVDLPRVEERNLSVIVILDILPNVESPADKIELVELVAGEALSITVNSLHFGLGEEIRRNLIHVELNLVLDDGCPVG